MQSYYVVINKSTVNPPESSKTNDNEKIRKMLSIKRRNFDR